MHISRRQARQANLLGALGLTVADRLHGVLADGALGSSAAASLIHARLRPGQTINFLACVLDISHPAAVRVVDRLERDGLLERRSAPDGRARALFLTCAGRAATSRILSQRGRAVADILTPLSPTERRQLETLLEKLLSGVANTRWDARHVCRLCDFAICSSPYCPVDVTVGDEDLSVAPAR